MKRATQMQQVMELPRLPDCLIRDEIPLPHNYCPPAWAVDLVEEWGKETDLVAAGAYPTQSVLLGGPSGVGKTTAARWIGHQLGKSPVSMLLSSAIDSFLGGTGKQLSSALRYAQDGPCVLILDEIDSVAASREAKHQDVGEVWRITNTFIQCLDHWHGARRESLLIGTTNMPDALDQAIRRRFEMEIQMGYPTQAELSRIAGMLVPDCKMSHAAMRRLVLQAKRRAIVKGEKYEKVLLSLLERTK